MLVDSTNPFVNGNMLPRGILREPVQNIRRADIIFLTKCRGDVSAVKDEIRRYNTTAEIVECRYDSCEVLYALNRTADMGADALVTTEKDAVRFPRLETVPVKCLYLRIAIEILAGGESFAQIINRICFRRL